MRLIDADAAREALLKHSHMIECGCIDADHVIATFAHVIPTIAAEPIILAEIKCRRGRGVKWWACSACSAHVSPGDKRCRECGAHFRKENQNG